MRPIVHGLEKQHGEQINFVYLNVDNPDNQEVMQVLGRRAQPEFFLLDEEGNILNHWYGRVQPEDFEQAFALALAE